MHGKSVFLLFKLLVNCVVWGLLSFLKGTDLQGDCFKYKVSLCDGRRGDILFLQKNLQISAGVDFRLVLQKFYFYAISVT